MKTVYLHIGTPKTGTSAIQKFMADNREILGKKGYCYPDISRELGYIRVLVDRNANFLAHPSTETNPKKKLEQESEWNRIAYERIGVCAREYDNIVLSEERIWHYCNKKKDFWTNIVENLKKQNCQLKVVVYLRRQDMVIQSLWSQKIKAYFLETKTFQESIETGSFNYFPWDYYNQLEKIAGYIGKENVLVRAYERSQFEGTDHSIYSDFLQTIGLEKTGEYVVGDSLVNPGLNGNYLEIKRWMNMIPEYRAMNDFMCLAVRKASVAQEKQNHTPKASMFTPQAQQEYMAGFEESNRRVAVEYLGRADGVLFLEPVKETVTWERNDETMYRDMVVLFAEAACEQQTRINQLSTEISEMKKKYSVKGMIRWFFGKLKRPFVRS